MAEPPAPAVDGAVDEPPDDAWPAAVARRYKRVEKIGVGMFSEVYKAWDRVDRRTVAVKHLCGRTDYRFVATELHQLAREAMSLRACRGHPCVVQLRATHADASRADGDCFLVMDYAGRINLRDYALLRRERRLLDGDRPPFREDEARAAMVQLLRAVACAHAAGVVHRDVEPESVVVRERRRTFGGRAVAYKLCGFGMSEPASREKEDGFAKLAASSPYRAPELFLGSIDYDGRVDTWGLGCVMAELLAGTGEPFFGGQPETSQLQYILETVGARGIKAWPGLQRSGVDPDTERMVRRCPDNGRLRELFPEKVISDDGFDVLTGLLESSPEERLTAEAALHMPWFNKPRTGRFPGCFA